MSQAGALVRHQAIGQWLAAVPEDEWPEEAADIVNSSNWDATYGDRRQEIVFIGLKAEMNESLIRETLDQCLVKDFMSQPEKSASLNDPFPVWGLEEA